MEKIIICSNQTEKNCNILVYFLLVAYPCMQMYTIQNKDHPICRVCILRNIYPLRLVTLKLKKKKIRGCRNVSFQMENVHTILLNKTAACVFISVLVYCARHISGQFQRNHLLVSNLPKSKQQIQFQDGVLVSFYSFCEFSSLKKN